MRLAIRYTFLLLFWANMSYVFAQNPIPAFPEIQRVDAILSSSSSQHYLILAEKGNPLLDKRTKKVKQWMVNLKEEERNTISFIIRTHKAKSLCKGTVRLSENKEWEVQIDEVMPGQAVMLLFVADHIDVNKGRLALLPQARAPFAPNRISAGKKLVESFYEKETELDFERWKLGQLRKYQDTGTQLPALREQAEILMKQYLQEALGAR